MQHVMQEVLDSNIGCDAGSGPRLTDVAERVQHLLVQQSVCCSDKHLHNVRTADHATSVEAGLEPQAQPRRLRRCLLLLRAKTEMPPSARRAPELDREAAAVVQQFEGVKHELAAITYALRNVGA